MLKFDVSFLSPHCKHRSGGAKLTDYLAMATWALVILTAVYATITYLTLSIMRRDRERKVIVEIVTEVLIPLIDNLKEDIRLLNEIKIDSFPNFLDMQLGIHSRHLQGDIFNRFATRKYILRWRLFEYNRLCKKINDLLNRLKRKGLDKNIITILTNSNGTRCTISEQYEDNDIKKILKNEGLSNDINYIVDAINENRIYNKAEKLRKKINKMKGKYIHKYYMTEKELGNW